MSTKLELAIKLALEKKEDVDAASELLESAKAELSKADANAKAGVQSQVDAAQEALDKAESEFDAAEKERINLQDEQNERDQKAAAKKAAAKKPAEKKAVAKKPANSGVSETRDPSEDFKAPYKVCEGRSLSGPRGSSLTAGMPVSESTVGGGPEAKGRLKALEKRKIIEPNT